MKKRKPEAFNLTGDQVMAELTPEEIKGFNLSLPQMTPTAKRFVYLLAQERIEKAALLAACKWTARGEHHRACSHYRKNPNTCDCYVGACKSAISAGESGE